MTMTEEDLQQRLKREIAYSEFTKSTIDNVCSANRKHSPEIKEYSMQLLNNTYIELTSISIEDRIDLLHSMIFRYPSEYTVYLNLGVLYYNTGKPIEARTFFRFVLLLNKDNIIALCHLAMIYLSFNTEYSTKIFTKVLTLTENNEDKNIRDMINNVRKAINQTEKVYNESILDKYIINAILDSSYENVPLDVKNALEKRVNDICQLLNTSDHDSKRKYILEVLFYEPGNISALIAMAALYDKLNKPLIKMSYLMMILRVDPKHKEALIQLGLSYRFTNKEWSLQIIKYVHSLYPQDPSICNNLAVLYNDNNYYSESKQLLINLLESGLEENAIHVSILCNLSTTCGCLSQNALSIEYSDKALRLVDKIHKNGGNKMLGINALHTKLMAYNNRLYDNDLVYKEHLKINDYFKDYKRLHAVKYVKGSYTGTGRIKIGYISSDIKNHVVSKFMIDLARSHDRDKFEIWIFLLCKQIDSIAEEYKKKVDHMVLLQGSDSEMANVINTAGIHILIELNGHTCDNRIGVMAYKPAPIQVSYLGYPNTTGLDEIDYRITDCVADHPDSLQKYSEKLVRMSGCFLLYNSLIFNPIMGFGVIEPKSKDSADKSIILGAINRPAKNHRMLLDIWGKILKSSAGTKILFKMKSLCNVEEEKKKFAKYLSIDEDRIIVLEYQGTNDGYLELFDKIDIMMDTMPYSGTTTTCDALYMSTPVVTMYNKDYHAHNVTSSILINCGHSELVSYSEEEYIQKIVDLSGDPERIGNYKKTLRQDFLNSQNPIEFTRKFEQCLVDMM